MTDYIEPSADYLAMKPYWDKVDAITTGVEAMRARSASYLPSFPNESRENYAYRVQSSRLTDIFSDITESLAAKPFTREVGLADDSAPAQIDLIVEDADRMGNHLHVFAQQMFYSGIAYGLDWIMVDYPATPAGATLADERRDGARPYLVRVEAKDMLEVRSAVVGASEIITYARIDESTADVARVRIFERQQAEGGGYLPAAFVVMERVKGGDWVEAGGGVLSIGEIPLIPFFTGRRIPGTWRFTLPMKRVADLQVEHYQQETNLKLAKENTCFPMLVGKGIAPPVGEDGKPVKLPVGPSTVLYAPMNELGTHGDWGVIEPGAASLQFLADQIAQTEAAMRELGRMPSVIGTAGITQVAAAAASQRASSAVQAWAYSLKDALEKALRYAAQWLGIAYEPTVYVDTDFAIQIGDDKSPELIVALQKDGLISLQTMLQELKRRGVLSPEVDEEQEAERVLREAALSGEPEPGEPVIIEDENNGT